MSLSGKHILLGVTGGIAAYKSVVLLREFQKAGADVRVTMTPSATRFVGTETFSTLSRQPVAIDIFGENNHEETWTRHIKWAEWADLFVIAPCTANTLSHLVLGQADTMLTAIALAIRCPMLICPTMDAEMHQHPAVRRNLELAEQYGFHVLSPESGYLASGLKGPGRLPDPTAILERASQILALAEPDGLVDVTEGSEDSVSSEDSEGSERPLTSKKVVVSAGPTREHIDPVRFISNPSSGKMGFAMAEAARRLGGDVTLLHGPVELAAPDGIGTEEFESAEDLFQLVKKHADADVVIMAAAVSDFRPESRMGHKIKKNSISVADDEKGELQGPAAPLTLVATPDSLAWLGRHKREGQILIGFAMETESLEENARKKLEQKNLDWICANNLSEEDSGFQSDSNRILLLGRESRDSFRGPKRDIAFEILKHIFQSG